MQDLLTGMGSIQDFLMKIGLAMASIFIVVAGIKFFIKGHRHLSDFVFEAISIIVGIFLVVSASAIQSSIAGAFFITL